MKLTEPDYENGLVDSDILAGFSFVDEDAEDDEVEVEIQMVGQTTATADTAALADLGLSSTAVASQQFVSAFEVNPNYDEPDLFSFFFELDMPEDILQDGAIISQYAQLTPTNTTNGTDKITVSCTVMVGLPEATQVKEYSGTTLMDFDSQNGKTYEDQNTDDVVADSDIEKSESFDFYALAESTSWENKIQKCLAQMKIDKIDRDEAFFQEYSMLLGARIYANRTDTAPKKIAETTYIFQVAAPVVEEIAYDEFTTDFPEDFEETFYILKEERKESTVDNKDGSEIVDLVTDLWIDYWANKAYTYSDKLEFTFNVDTNLDFFPNDTKVFQYATFISEADSAANGNF